MDTRATIDRLSSRAARYQERVRLTIQVSPEAPVLRVQKKTFPQTFSDGDVLDFNQRFVSILDRLRRRVQRDLTLSTEERDDYLAQLRTVGLGAYKKVLPDAARAFVIEEDSKQQERQRGLTMTFVTPPSLSLLWEMFYAGKASGKIEAEQFWGFRYPLGRAYWDVDTAGEYIEIRSGIFSVIHNQLKNSLAEVEQLALHISHMCQVLGLKLKVHLLDHELIIPLASLSGDRLMEWFNSDEFCYGIVHFACHCENFHDQGASQAYLRLTALDHKLDMRLDDLLARQGEGFLNQPLVFLNACESATSDHLLQSISFPTGLLNFGAGGVIATACVVPDNFAGAFAGEFYKRLLGKEKFSNDKASSIGQALLETRLHFLEKYNNPLGLAYGLYAESYQQLSLIE